MQTEYFVVVIEYVPIKYRDETIYVTEPSTYDEALEKKHEALQNEFVKNARIAKLSFLD